MPEVTSADTRNTTLLQLLGAVRGWLVDAFGAVGSEDARKFAMAAGSAVEQLAKSVLCSIHPTLIATDLHTQLNFLGLPELSPTRGKPLRTIGAKDAIEGCRSILPFVPANLDALRRLSEDRNAAAHLGVGEAGIDDGGLATLHGFVNACATFLRLDADELAPGFGDAIRAKCTPVDTLPLRIVCRICEAARHYRELAERFPEVCATHAYGDEPADTVCVVCPACGRQTRVGEAQQVVVEQRGGWRVDVKRVIIERLLCPRCKLLLNGDEELAAAGIPREIDTEWAEAPTEGGIGWTSSHTVGNMILTCADCGAAFVFTSRDQEFFAERNFTLPKRCRACAKARRQALRADFATVCDNCGRPTTVPFQPKLDETTGKPVKPIFCCDCFDERSAPVSEAVG
jgi:CxxC-x17-CxxC domain-containing protein